MAIRALAGLVPAAVNGVMGDLAIAAPEGIVELPALADQAGCSLIEAPDTGAALLRALAQARYDIILVSTLDVAMPPGFYLELESLRRAGVHTMIMRREASGIVSRLLPVLSPPAMLVAPRTVLLEHVRPADTTPGIPALARRLKGARPLKAEAIALLPE
jgi:hypothetical protein